MEKYRLKKDTSGGLRVETPSRGARLLRHPMYNKGSAFSQEERERLGLVGLLPGAVNTMEQQAQRALSNILRSEDPLQRYMALAALQDRNEHLFYRVLADNLEQLLPIVYTPTVGLACQQYSHIFRRARGLWITPEQRGYIYRVLGNAPFEDVRLIVVTDNERILGLGDQGAGGMCIPIGKLAVYSAAAGIHPSQTLPISLDVGTDNERLLQDELYLGWRQPRLRGPDYESLVDEFVYAVKKRFPRAILQWEDFKKGNAFRLLARYRTVLPSFNDDIQGTAAVALAGISAAARKTSVPLARQRTVILGAGAAGIGIASLLRSALRRCGVTSDVLFEQVAVLDSRGLLVDDAEIPDSYKREFAWPAALAERHGLGKQRPRDLAAVVAALEPTVLIGVTGEPGTFGEAVVRTLADRCRQPLLMPMSNPTSRLEAHPAELARWSQGRALIATGSNPVGPVSFEGRSLRVGEGNNGFVFPGVALGVMVSGAHEVTDQLFAVAAEALAHCVSGHDLAAGGIFPEVRELRRVTARVAEAVVRAARESGLGRRLEDADIPGVVAEAMWEPRYLPLEHAPLGERSEAREQETLAPLAHA
jgi:malic enzyme